MIFGMPKEYIALAAIIIFYTLIAMMTIMMVKKKQKLLMYLFLPFKIVKSLLPRKSIHQPIQTEA